MAVRKKRSISMPRDLDAEVQAAAIASRTTHSAWLAAVVRKEFLIGDGLAGAAQFEREHGTFSDAEMAEAEAWAGVQSADHGIAGAVGVAPDGRYIRERP